MEHFGLAVNLESGYLGDMLAREVTNKTSYLLAHA